ncbi:MAG: DoxX family protein [Janthinobacterium lividum]
MSSSYTPTTRPDGYTTSTSGSTGRSGSTGTSGSFSSYGRDGDRDPDVRPVKPRGHARADLGLLVLRLGLAAMMLAHGYQKFVLQGSFSFTANQAAFAQMGVPLPQVAGVLIIILELAGGVAMVFGLFTVLVGICYTAAMAAAVWYVHLAHGFFVADNGYELAGLTGVVALVLAISGAGRISLDRAIFGAKRRRRIREAREAGLA